MTSIQEITDIVKDQVFNTTEISNFNRDQANEQLQIARETDSLGEQVLALIKVVNRTDITDPEIKSELKKFDATLRLIKAVNLSFRKSKPVSSLSVEELYDKAVAEFTK
jgi:Zn-dependent metalloprotease